jgi:hypothetical protein
MTGEGEDKLSSDQWFGLVRLDWCLGDNAIWNNEPSLIKSSDDGIFDIDLFYCSFGVYGS